VDELGKKTELEVALYQRFQHRRLSNRPSLDRHQLQFPSRHPFRALAEANPSASIAQRAKKSCG
jgi:hypothetical protein